MSADRWQALLKGPAALADDAAFASWFDALAERLLTGTRFLVGREPHRFTEVEFYYHGPGHLDPFTHREAVQRGHGTWYFHRTAGVLRGGSFKGLDLTFGGEGAFGGILFRGLVPEGGDPIDGPSLCVDHLISRTAAGTVATLDRAVAGRPAWDPANPLSLVWLDQATPRQLLKTARVGLSLKRMRANEAGPRFLLRRYRYLADPRRTAKGKLHMALALHADGAGALEIRERTGCTNAALLRYLTDYQEGQGESGFDRYFGLDLGPRELARLHGLWQKTYGATGR